MSRKTSSCSSWVTGESQRSFSDQTFDYPLVAGMPTGSGLPRWPAGTPPTTTSTPSAAAWSAWWS